MSLVSMVLSRRLLPFESAGGLGEAGHLGSVGMLDKYQAVALRYKSTAAHVRDWTKASICIKVRSTYRGTGSCIENDSDGIDKERIAKTNVYARLFEETNDMTGPSWQHR